LNKAALKALGKLYALDLGTTKFCLGALRQVQTKDKNSHFQVSSVSVPAEGMHRGMLANMNTARAAVNKLIDVAENQHGTDIREVIVGVAGSHLQSRLVTISQTLGSNSVTPADMVSLIKKAEEQEVHETREILHVVPVSYRLDDRDAVDEPLGFSGRTLFGTFFIIDADKYYLKDIVDLCNDCGLQVRRLYSEPFASASVTVPDDYKNLGCVLADIGGGTTDGLVFQNGKPHFSFTINVAGKLMTNDIAVGLNLPYEEAEKLKIRFGLKAVLPKEVIECVNIHGQIKGFQMGHVLPILAPRIQELCALLTRQLVLYRGNLGGGLILTGGGAEVRGIEEFYHNRLKIPVHRAKPHLPRNYDFISSTDSLSGSYITHPTKHATMIGLLNLEIGRVLGELSNKQTTWTDRYLGQFFNWIKELS
jgi:cell division protein FtsA